MQVVPGVVVLQVVPDLVKHGRGSDGSSSLVGLTGVAFPLLQDAAGPLGQGQPPCPHLLLVSNQLMLHLALLVLQQPSHMLSYAVSVQGTFIVSPPARIFCW